MTDQNANPVSFCLLRDGQQVSLLQIFGQIYAVKNEHIQIIREILSEHRIWCEFFDSDFVVLMFTPSNLYRDFDRLREALASIPPCPALPETALPAARPEQVCSLREAMLSPCVRVPAVQSLGRVLARPGVSCPPAVPIRMPGERIDEAAIAAFDAYEIQVCDVLP